MTHPTGPAIETETELGTKPVEAAETGARIYGESAHDRVTSMLLAVVLGALMIFGSLSLYAATTSAYQTRVTRPIEVIEVSGGGGGTPEGKVGSVEAVDVAGGEASEKASNNEEDASRFEEPRVELRPSAMLDVAEAGEALAEVDISTVMPRGERVATGTRRSKVGNGGPGYGYGPGDGGVRREDRWSILYKTGQTADEYARQLDTFRVELAIVSGNQLVYVSNFAQAQPTKRLGNPADDKRLYFVWQGKGRKDSDIILLAKAGLDVGEGVIFQFYPPQTESVLEQLEVRYKGKQPAEIRNTKFGVVQAGRGYTFEVVSQEYLR